MSVGWFPGHMARTIGELRSNIKLIHVVVEMVDARAPLSTSHPDIEDITGQRPRVTVLNKRDLADPMYVKAFLKSNPWAVATNSVTGEGISEAMELALAAASNTKEARSVARGQRFRAAIVGLPNVGKSSFVNRVSKRARARTGDKPGVTRGRQWIVVNPSLELLDTPGIMPPRVDDQAVWSKLSILGLIDDSLLDMEGTAANLIRFLLAHYPKGILSRYDIPEGVTEPHEVIEIIGAKRGCLKPGGVPDVLRASELVVREFRSGKLGLASLDLESGVVQ